MTVRAMRIARKSSDLDLDPSIEAGDLLREILRRGSELLRGLLHWRRVRGAAPVFFERGVSIRSPNKVSLGKGTSIGRNAVITARGGRHIRLGTNVTLGAHSTITVTGVLRSAGGSVDIGDNVGIGPNAFLAGQGGLTVQESTIAGPGLMIFTEDHEFGGSNTPIRAQGEVRSPVVIEAGCWLGARVTILRGVTIGAGSMIAAGSVVTRDVPQGVLAAGVPAKIVRHL